MEVRALGPSDLHLMREMLALFGRVFAEPEKLGTREEVLHFDIEPSKGDA